MERERERVIGKRRREVKERKGKLQKEIKTVVVVSKNGRWKRR